MTLMLMMALILDKCLGEPRRFHPLVGFGHYALFLERKLYLSSSKSSSVLHIFSGILCWILAVLPVVLLVTFLMWAIHAYLPVYVYWISNVVILYFTVGQKSLHEHGLAVYQPLSSYDKNLQACSSKELNDLCQSRTALSMIVSRDTKEATPQQIATSTIETITENTHDAVIGPMIFFIFMGAPGAILFRLCNTLDAMWGYRTDRYEKFGKWSARADDLLGYIPARVTALLMVLASPMNIIKTIKSIWITGRAWYSPNAGLVMAAGAGALGIKLGGNAIYNGKEKGRLLLGFGKTVCIDDIKRSIQLMYKTSILLIMVVAVLEWIVGLNVMPFL